MSLQTSGNAIRQAATEARYVLLQIALEELEANPQDLFVKDGQIVNSATGVATDYWRLFGGKPFNHQIKGIAQPKAADAYGLVGTNATRVDLLPKVTGTLPYVQDLQLADMVHARIVRPPTYQSTLLAVDTAVVEQMSGRPQSGPEWQLPWSDRRTGRRSDKRDGKISRSGNLGTQSITRRSRVTLCWLRITS